MRHNVLSITLCLLLSSFVTVQQDTRAVLDKVRAQFSEDFDRARAVLERALLRDRESAKRRGDLPAYERFGREVEQFLDCGTLPLATDTTIYLASVGKACAKVEGAFKTARASALRAGDDQALKALGDELRTFRCQHMGMAYAHYLGAELLRNPDAEAGMDGKSPAGWRTVVGRWGTGKRAPDTAEGEAHFYADPSATAELAQTVTLDGLDTLIDDGALDLRLRAAVRSFAQQPGDTTQILVEFLDQRGKPVAGGYDSGPLCVKDRWRRLEETIDVPIGARSARLRLVTQRRGARTKSNDGYFDDLSLRLALDSEP